MLHLVLQLTLPPLVEKSSAAAQYLIVSKSFGNAYFKKVKKITLPRLKDQRTERKKPFGVADPAASENQHQGDGRRNELWQDEKVPLP